ncbi:double-strand-break repair protein rad21-like protein 1 [Varanus komodoensis]|uniref:double-strand-break repair protein rad21-like protein 1 n=1 Tax=Varanus komodoensis TaxID=61221 RepID=UPI001CF7C95C|nr:double-strand-break repair protein rad21-like protein 1 [Varanus komodoensis]
MFYMQLLMNKRGPLAKIWLAAHWDKKVTKAHIFECNLETTIEKILSPKVKIALRTSGHLLLGVVRIYHRKAKYLLADCTEALLKMQSTFRPGLVDLPKGNSEATYDAITLPEEFYDFDTQLPEVNAIDVAQHFTLNQSRAEDITLIEEDLRQDVLFRGDSFGEEIDISRQHSFFGDSLLTNSSSLLADHSLQLNFSGDKIALDKDAYALKYDGFGDEGAGRDMIDDVLGTEQNSFITDFDMEEECFLPQELPVDNTVDHPKSKEESRSHKLNETTQLSSEDEGFVLQPIDDAVLTRKQRGKRKRKLLVDAVKQLSGAAMQNQLIIYKDTMAPLDIAPPTKRLMILQELGSADVLLNRPTQPLLNEELQMLFVKSLRNRRKQMQQEREVEEQSKKQDAQELQVAESQSVLQDTSYLETQSTLQNGRDKSGNSLTFEDMEAIDAVPASSNGSLLDCSVRQESGIEQTGMANEHQGSDPNNEEKRRRKKTLELLNTFQHIHQKGAKPFSFLALCRNNNSKEVAVKFFSLLVLKKQQVVEVAQAAPFADILVTVGPKFPTLKDRVISF